MMDERNLTQDGFEMVFTANHLSHFLLTNLLLYELEKTNGRIVNLSSSLYKLSSSFNFEDVMSVKSYSLFGTYSQSKLANILFTVEMQRRLTDKGSKVTCNAVHPGIVRTEVTKNMNSIMQFLNSLVLPIMLLFQKSAPQGAYCSVFVAVDPSLEGVGGKYYVDSVAYPLRQAALDPVAGQKLWDLSQTLTGLK
jgi:retinol dehydrogenase 12